MGGFNKYLFLRVFFSFKAVASVDFFYLRVGRVRPGVGGFVKGDMWGGGGVRNKFKQKRGRVKAIFFYNLCPDDFFSNGQ